MKPGEFFRSVDSGTFERDMETGIVTFRGGGLTLAVKPLGYVLSMEGVPQPGSETPPGTMKAKSDGE